MKTFQWAIVGKADGNTVFHSYDLLEINEENGIKTAKVWAAIHLPAENGMFMAACFDRDRVMKKAEPDFPDIETAVEEISKYLLDIGVVDVSDCMERFPINENEWR